MSIIFETTNETGLWNPSSRVGRTYIGIVRVAEEALEHASGISDIESDTVTVDPEVVAEFFSLLVAEMEHGNQVLATQLEGVVVITLALLQRAGISPDVPSSHIELLSRSADIASILSYP